MIQRTYMGVDERRDHSFRIPRPDLSMADGTPNACTDCHADKDAAWAAAEIAARFPDSRHRGPHWGTLFAAAREAPEGQVTGLLDMAEWQGPGIVRATALSLLPPLPAGPALDRVALLLVDPDPLVREAAVGAFSGIAATARLRVLTPALADPARAVRVAAARALVDVPPDTAGVAALAAALQEWQTALGHRTDFPETHLQIGGAALTMRDFRTAVAAFGEAVTQDPQLTPAWAMIVRIYAATGDLDTARRVLVEAVRINPNTPELFALETELGTGSLLPPQP
jgi:tetratricopeptide (TPR) repeat protein